MKTEEAVSKRIRKLRLRYAKKYVRASQARCHRNCRYNHGQPAPSNGSRLEPDIERPMDLPVKNGGKVLRPPERPTARTEGSSLVVYQETLEVRYCTYGMDDPASWSGDLCEDDAKAESCPMFDPIESRDEAEERFLELLEDDDWVYENHRDLAALQWVLDDSNGRTPRGFLGPLERLILWLSSLFVSVPRLKEDKTEPFEDISDEELEEGNCDEELTDIWDDPSEDSGA